MHSLFDATVTTREARIAFRRKLEADAVVSGARDSVDGVASDYSILCEATANLRRPPVRDSSVVGSERASGGGTAVECGGLPL